MIRWVAVIFLALTVFYPLLPVLSRFWVGRLPFDLRFKVRGIILCLPFGSTVAWSVLAFLLARLVRLF